MVLKRDVTATNDMHTIAILPSSMHNNYGGDQMIAFNNVEYESCLTRGLFRRQYNNDEDDDGNGGGIVASFAIAAAAAD